VNTRLTREELIAKRDSLQERAEQLRSGQLPPPPGMHEWSSCAVQAVIFGPLRQVLRLLEEENGEER
jgi:hypothetical protein